MQPRPTSGEPGTDAMLALHDDVVLRADESELVVLRHSPYFRCWYVCGCPAVSTTRPVAAADSDLQWQGVGYVDHPAVQYAVFQDDPHATAQEWNDFYQRHVSPQGSQPPRR